MRAPGSTILVVAGEGADAVLRGLNRHPNVTAVALRGEDAAVASDGSGSRSVDSAADAVQQLVASAHSPYVLHDRDPLDRVASAWVSYFDDPAVLSELDLEVELAIASLARRQTLLPDYYVVLGPESLPRTRRHWWLGALASIAPTRVLPSPPNEAAVEALLRALPTGRDWPDPASWLRDLKTLVPDRVGLL
jgi:hypothetical protein